MHVCMEVRPPFALKLVFNEAVNPLTQDFAGMRLPQSQEFICNW